MFLPVEQHRFVNNASNEYHNGVFYIESDVTSEYFPIIYFHVKFLLPRFADYCQYHIMTDKRGCPAMLYCLFHKKNMCQEQEDELFDSYYGHIQRISTSYHLHEVYNIIHNDTMFWKATQSEHTVVGTRPYEVPSMIWIEENSQDDRMECLTCAGDPCICDAVTQELVYISTEESTDASTSITEEF